MHARIALASGAGLLLMLSMAQAVELDPVAEAKRLEAGYARLCGVWEWTVHCHTLSHREGKSQIVLPSPEAAGVPGPAPAEIPIHGNAVELAADVAGGHRRASLLLPEKRRR